VSTVLAIDPGNQQSAYCLIDVETRQPELFGKVDNAELIKLIRYGRWLPNLAAIEMVASYGMAVGADVFETCVWIGRFAETIRRELDDEPMLIKRNPIKLHFCQSGRAKDSNIRQALIDRFGGNASNGGKGTKADPGWFYGFAADIWSAYAIAVYVADTTPGPGEYYVDPNVREEYR
jgi:hypothetical protein